MILIQYSGEFIKSLYPIRTLEGFEEAQNGDEEVTEAVANQIPIAFARRNIVASITFEKFISAQICLLCFTAAVHRAARQASAWRLYSNR